MILTFKESVRNSVPPERFDKRAHNLSLKDLRKKKPASNFVMPSYFLVVKEFNAHSKTFVVKKYCPFSAFLFCKRGVDLDIWILVIEALGRLCVCV